MGRNMSDNNYTRDRLMEFLKQSAMAGFINPATARSRRTAAEELLTRLTDEESEDLRQVDVDELCSRFHKLQGSSIRPETLKLYNNRLKSALTDFFAWSEDPDNFVSVGGDSRSLRKRSDVERTRRSAEEKALEEIKLGAPETPAEILPVPIRPDLVVFIQNLPLDLTSAEAGKICRVVEALAQPDTDEPTGGESH